MEHPSGHIHDAMRRRTTDELLAIWQAHDREQWTETAFDAIRGVLEERGVSLTAVSNCAAEVPAAPEPEEIVTLTGFATQGEAQLARSILDAEGIEGFVASEVAYRLSAGQPIRLQVRLRDAERASELLGLDIGQDAGELLAAGAPAGRGTEMASAPEPDASATEAERDAAALDPASEPAGASAPAPSRPAIRARQLASDPRNVMFRRVAVVVLVATLISAALGLWQSVVQLLASRILTGF